MTQTNMEMNSPKILFIGGIVAGAAASSLVFFVYRSVSRPAAQEALAPSQAGAKVDCTVTEAQKTVQGVSLGNLIKDGSKIKALENYYACASAGRGDIVEYQSGASVAPLVKVVMGVPGDLFDLAKAKSGGWNILINGTILENSDAKPYVVNDQAYRILALYVHDYKGVIPSDAYLIMGEVPGGSLDSTRFGLVGRTDFLGKVSQ